MSNATLRLFAIAAAAAAFSSSAAAQGTAGASAPTDSSTTQPQGSTANATAQVSCLARPNVRRMQIVDAQNILFVMRDKTTYRNVLVRQCPGLRRNSQISLTASDRQVCAGASFQVLLRTGSSTESVMVPGGQSMSVPRPSFVPGPVCNLGAFSAITNADVTALVDSSRASRRTEQSRDDEEEKPATPEAR
jgi:hypothetical protein